MEYNNITDGKFFNYNIKCNWGTYAYYKDFFNDNLIKDLDNLVNTHYSFSKGETGIPEIGLNNSLEKNNRDIAYIGIEPYSSWLYDLLTPLMIEANNMLFGFDLDFPTDPIHYIIYPENSGHLDWHMDVNAYQTNKRKLSMTIQLSDPSEYEGGEFELWTGGSNSFIEVPRKKGDVIIFPSFLMHRIKPVTKGQRKSLVYWVGGRPFR